MARKRSLSSVLAEPADVPDTVHPVPEQPTGPAPAGTGDPGPSIEHRRPVRSTLDLPREQHEAFVARAAGARDVVGRKVLGQHVLRALVARYLADDALAAAVAEDLRREHARAAGLAAPFGAGHGVSSAGQ